MFISTTLNKDVYTVYILQKNSGNMTECFGKLDNIDDFSKRNKIRQIALDKFASAEYNTSVNIDTMK